MKLLAVILAAISVMFGGNIKKPDAPLIPLNTAIITYAETYYAPTVASPDNFPFAKTVRLAFADKPKQEIKPSTPAPVIQPMQSTPPPPAPVLPPIPAGDSYLANPEPITSWLNMNATLTGNSLDNNPRTLPEITFDREYWRIQVIYYWAPNIVPPKPQIQNGYFKLEVYEKGTDKLIYTMTSGTDNTGYPRVQSFRKPGTYYFKVYTIDPSQWEITFTVSPKLAQQ